MDCILGNGQYEISELTQVIFLIQYEHYTKNCHGCPDLNQSIGRGSTPQPGSLSDFH